jgi:hypothetical protein
VRYAKPHTWVPLRLRPQFVYFLQNVETGHIKIGQSYRPEERVKHIGLQVGRSRLRFLGKAPGTRETERGLHKRFAADALGHEWFRPSPLLLAVIEFFSLPDTQVYGPPRLVWVVGSMTAGRAGTEAAS